jgi:hypothetical protein
MARKLHYKGGEQCARGMTRGTVARPFGPARLPAGGG